MSVELHHGDCLAVIREMADASVDAVITDPPYGINIDKSNPWDKPVDIAAFTAEAARVGRDFCVVFGQMPTLMDWHAAAVANGMYFMEHISWVKRSATMGNRLSRGHESILIYSIGEHRTFHRTRGPYEDVKLPGVLVDVTTLDSIRRYIGEMQRKIDGHHGFRTNNVHQNPAWGTRYPRQGYESAPREVNYTNVWSFLPPGQRKRTGEYNHPAQKPVDIMRRLVAMTCAPGGTVLDPFAGSGTTGCAALLEGVNFIGIEQDAGFVEIARQRIADIQSRPMLPIPEEAA